MSVSSVVTTAITGTSPRITLIGVLPSTILVLFFLFLMFSLSTPPTIYPELNLVSNKLSSISLEQIAGIVIAITAISLIIEPLQIALLRIFEGYWKREGFIGKIRKFGLQIQLEQSQKYKNQGRRFDEYFPSTVLRFLPTSFGNRLRAAEDMAGNRFGLDTVFFWPRIYPLLPDNMKNIVDDKINQELAFKTNTEDGQIEIIETFRLKISGNNNTNVSYTTETNIDGDMAVESILRTHIANILYSLLMLETGYVNGLMEKE